MAEMHRIRREIPRVATTVYHGLSHSLDTMSLAKKHAPIASHVYDAVLADAGNSGRAMRAITSLAAPVKDLNVTAVSDFVLSYEGTLCGQVGHNLFAAFADARSFRVVEPVPRPWLKKIAHSEYARERLGNIEEAPDYYYLTLDHAVDVVLAMWACNCCFDAQYLDYLKSAADLKNIGSMLLIRKLSAYFDSIEHKLTNSPFMGWMIGAGFEPTVLLAFNPPGRPNVLFPLNGLDIAAEMKDISARLWTLFGVGEESKTFKHSFELYLAFQRIKLVGNEVLRGIFREGIAWEKDHYDERHKPSSVPGIGTPKDEAMLRFNRFEHQQGLI